MDKELAQALGPLVSNQKLYSALKEYAKKRIEWYHLQMEQEADTVRLNRHQGAIKELRRIESLYNEIIALIREG